jgi:molecular chaperone Hsp33
MLRHGDSPEQMLRRIFHDGLEILDRRDVRFECHCSQDRAERAIGMLGTAAIEEMIGEGAGRGGTEVTCEFCTERYIVATTRLHELLQPLAAEGHVRKSYSCRTVVP